MPAWASNDWRPVSPIWRLRNRRLIQGRGDDADPGRGQAMPYYAMRDGAQLFVRTVGWGEPCVLLHGLAMDSRQWLPLVWPYVVGQRFILPDLRGFGRSRRAPLRDTDPFIQYAQDLADLLPQLGYPAVRLGGLSLGALIGLQYLALTGGKGVSHYLHIDHPAYVTPAETPDSLAQELLSLGHTLVGLTDELQIETERPLAALPDDYRALYFATLSLLVQSALEANYQKLAVRLALNTPAVQRLAPWVTSADAWPTVVTILRAYLTGQFDVRPALPNLTLPVTCMVGLRNDLFHLRDLLAVAAALPHSRLVEFAASSHLLPLTEPFQFQREFKRFLQE